MITLLIDAMAHYSSNSITNVLSMCFVASKCRVLTGRAAKDVIFSHDPVLKLPLKFTRCGNGSNYFDTNNEPKSNIS